MPSDPYRLSRSVVPRTYMVTLEPELSAGTFSGSVIIQCDVIEASASIVLNSIELLIHSVTVDGRAATFSLDEDSERLSVDAAVQPGPVTLEISFAGVLNDKLRGFYRSTYSDEDGIEHVIACSQMQATDCRRAFPCFDEPDFKATFGITLVIDDGLMAVSNGAESSRQTLPSGRVAVTFQPTMPMSTYLVAVIVGRLDATEAVDVDGTPMRILHVPGKSDITSFAIEAGEACLAWFQEYYGIAYPAEKLDMVALPDFAAGAMENLGCITYREPLLLIDPDSSTQLEQQVVADVVSHEIAHMWFGDLVTMRWWNGIWLNEAFATFMEVMAVDAFRPEWKRWTNFSLERTDAFEVDSLASTRTVEFEVRAPSDCEGMFDVLTYSKGAALLRMLQQYIGEERFRQGVNNYLRAHSYANTETGDLWDGIEAVTTADGGREPIRELMDSWIWQAGFPLISADLVGDELRLRQQRFSFDLESTEPTLFIVPIAVRIGNTTHRVLLDSAETRLPVGGCSDPIVVNAGGQGFFRVAYDDFLRERLGTAALAQLDTIERYNLVDDASAAFVAGRLSASALLSFLSGFTDETELAVWQAVGSALRRLDRVVEGDAIEAFNAAVRGVVGPALERLGWTPPPDEDDLQSKLRGLLVTLAATLGAEPEARQRCRALLISRRSGQDNNADPELVSASITVVASIGDASDFDCFVEAYREGQTPQDQIRNLYALGEFSTAELIERACEFAFSGEVRTQNAPYLLQRCIANRAHGELAWSIVRRRWAEANEAFPNPSIVRMVDPVKLLNTQTAVADVQSFFSEHPIKQSATTLAQVLERQRVNAAVRERESARFARSLLVG